MQTKVNPNDAMRTGATDRPGVLVCRASAKGRITYLRNPWLEATEDGIARNDAKTRSDRSAERDRRAPRRERDGADDVAVFIQFIGNMIFSSGFTQQLTGSDRCQ